jgi:aerobic-type carbon monoxide dehydrogenase small subunit (CoxS/CutS family)
MADNELQVTVNGVTVSVPDDGSSLLTVLRERLGLSSVKDGCAPQGQCGCCTVLVDGQPRVSCVTPVRRVRSRAITTVEGLDPAEQHRWSEAFCTTGASQCGFCTPGIVLRFAALAAKGTAADDRDAARRALAAHLCRCTGWHPILDAYKAAATPVTVAGSHGSRDLAAAGTRAEIEGGAEQRVDLSVALGQAGFAGDEAPGDALVAVPTVEGTFVVAESLAEAWAEAGKVQGRRTTSECDPPLALPEGEWAHTLRTSWVEPAYLEVDASWCRPGGEPASPLANGGAFGAKVTSPARQAARRLADKHGRPVRVVFSREEAVRQGPKRPPIAAGLRADGSAVVRVVRTRRIAEALRAGWGSEGAPIDVESVDCRGPRTSTALRAAGWAEAAVLRSALVDEPAVAIQDPMTGGWARVEVEPSGSIQVVVRGGDPLDDAVLRSYCMGAVHMGLGWVTSEGLSVDDGGQIQDLTIRSFGVLRATEVPPVHVVVEPDEARPRRVSDAVFVATAAALWRHQGYPPDWPTGRLPDRPAD